MLTTESLQEFHEIIAADRCCRKIDSARLPVSDSYYAKLLNWMMEVRTILFAREAPKADLASSFFWTVVSQHMEEIGCQSITRYLAKIYLDTFLLQQASVPTAQLQLVGIAAIKLAVKFNESFDYPVATAIHTTGNQYSAAEILGGEQLLLQTLKFKLKVTTPFCYIKSIKELVPLDNPSLYSQLDLLIEYCSMLPELVGLTSGEVFFAVFIYLCKIKGANQVRSVVLALANRWPNIEAIAEQIGCLLEQDVQDHPENQDDSSMLVEE